jgi:hypothetical protein
MATPPPPADTLRERLRDWKRSLSRFNKLAHWMVTRGLWWFLGFVVLYTVSGSLIGWARAYEVLVGITSPAATSFPVLGWLLSLTGWLAVPALVGATAGYLVGRQVDERRAKLLTDLMREMQAQGQAPPPPPPPPAGGPV